MKNTRHPKLTEFIGLVLEPQRTFIVEGKKSIYPYNAISRFNIRSPVTNQKNIIRILHQGVLSRCTCKPRYRSCLDI
jgi:hypothetical protein